MTLNIDDFRLPPALDIGSRGGLYMIQGGFSMAEVARPAGPDMPLQAAASYL
jgi:hypothetical protein